LIANILEKNLIATKNMLPINHFVLRISVFKKFLNISEHISS